MENRLDNVLVYGMSKDEMKCIIKAYNEKRANMSTEVEDGCSDYLYLKHGTCANNLPGILESGLVGRKLNNNNNFIGAESSESLIYLTDKWHYMYSFISVKVSYDRYLLSQGIDIERFENDRTDEYSEGLLDYWQETGNVPVVITVKVKKSDLLVDEDIVYSKDFMRHLKIENELNLNYLSYESSLSQHTVACKSPILLDDIKKIEIIAYDDIYDIMANSGYGKSFSDWCRGFSDDYSAEDIYIYMEDENLGGMDEINLEMLDEGYVFDISYDKDGSCVLVRYNL